MTWKLAPNDAEAIQQAMRDGGWNCQKITGARLEEPDHFGQVFRVACETKNLTGEARTLTYRVTFLVKPLDGPKIEPWK